MGNCFGTQVDHHSQCSPGLLIILFFLGISNTFSYYFPWRSKTFFPSTYEVFNLNCFFWSNQVSVFLYTYAEVTKKQVSKPNGLPVPTATDTTRNKEIFVEDNGNSTESMNRRSQETSSMPANGKILSTTLKIFTLAELKASTRNFRPDTVLGEGGFGRVFKGWVDEKTYAPSKVGVGMAVAVKKSNPDSSQGLQEWQVHTYIHN